MLKDKRNGSVEIIRFFLSFLIVLYHGMYGGYFSVPGGYLAVEAFFIISRYYLAAHCRKTKNQSAVNICGDTLNYVYRRIVAVYPQMIIGTIIGIFFFYFINDWSLLEFLKWLRYTINDLAFLQSFGFPVASVTGVIWYFSSYLIAIIVLCPIFTKYGRTFCLYIAPLSAFFISGILIYNFGTFDVPANWIFGIINTGNLRAISMLCLGGFLYELVPLARSRLRGKTIYITILELVLYLCFFLHVYFYSDGSGMFDEQAVFCFAGALTITESERSYTTHFKNSKVALYLGKFSSAIFFGHFIWVQNANALVQKISFWENHAALVGFIGAMISSLIVFFLENPVRRGCHFIRQSLFT